MVIYEVCVLLLLNCEVVVGDITDTVWFLAANVSDQQCSNLIRGLRGWNESNLVEIESSSDCAETVVKILENFTEDEASARIVMELEAMNESNLVKTLRKREMHQQVEIMRDYETRLKLDGIGGVGRVDLLKKLHDPPGKETEEMAAALDWSNPDLIAAAVVSSVFVLLLIVYVLSVLWTEVLLAIPTAYVTTDFDLLIR